MRKESRWKAEGYISDCCKAEAECVTDKSDYSDKYGGTVWTECTKCRKSCSLIKNKARKKK